ncbi:type VI secretion system Vgr family protein [Chondromyces apiculatus]|uniref:VgrG protein n=1 Tax=Chondromyces apiculatus DSM 436 TaxID=1192034 RepID=A0A017T866_9BACT|nr:type VI secretion system tip protein TssI/VgrG [Chondromyces apiculatus]EYF05453.1 VgrG protein [Chondromyces apiculatus DSM 436]
MPLLELSFASQEDSLSVRHFAVREEISNLFEVAILARSPSDEIDLESIVGQGAGFAMDGGITTPRVWTGICSHMELLQVESTGLSTYFLKIAPALWRTTLRRNNRIFQHISIPDIVTKVLAEWQIVPELRLSGEYLQHEYRVQYGETDFAFVNRLLEEAGIAYFFAYDGSQSVLVLSDEPTSGNARAPLLFVDNPGDDAEHEYITKVKLIQRVKPGRFTFRDFDFRNRLDYQLLSEARAQVATELPYEQYSYEPGAFWYEPGRGGDTPVADDKGIARTSEKEGNKLVTRALDGERRTRRMLSYEANVADLAPGALLTIDAHPRGDIAQKKLLAIAASFEGEPGAAWTFKGEAVYTDATYRPERRTPRPRIRGVQSAVVVGPAGEEIHVDEFGRVRVQFHWDREGTFDDNSSCWIRVSQGWAGAGYGLLNLPRVGQEVLVEFFEGDPDRPVVTGRVFSQTRGVPYKLPDNKTKSGWKSATSPGAGGFNELSFEDAAGREVIHIQAQKDFTELVKNNQSSTVLNNRSASITANDSMTVGASQSFNVGQSQSHTIGKSQKNDVGESRVSTIAKADSIEAGDTIRGTVGPEGVGYAFNKDQTITLTNKVASIVFTPEGLRLDAQGDLHITANGTLRLSGGEVKIDGKPNVYVNCDAAASANVPTLDPARPPKPPGGPGSGGETIEAQSKLSGQGTVEEPGGFEEVTIDLASLAPPPTPSAVPAAINIGGGAASAINAAVAKAAPVIDAVESARSFLARDPMSQALTLVQSPVGEQVLGPVLTNPITGGLTGSDLVGILGQGQQVGIFHLASAGAAAAGVPGSAAATLAAAAAGMPGAAAAPLAAAAAAGVSGAAALPAGVQQFMALRTQAAPPKLDGTALSNAFAQNRVLGLSTAEAHSAALGQQGVALFRGNGAGVFHQVLPTGQSDR